MNDASRRLVFQSTSNHIAASIELARLVAIVWVVVLHIARTGWGSGGVIVFLALSLGLLKPRARSLCDTVRQRARRLLLPWLAWCSIYGLMVAAQRVVERHAHWSFEPTMLLYGPQIHLWFLPYLFIASVAVDALLRTRPVMAAGRGMLMLAVIAATGSAIIAIGHLLGSGRVTTYPFPQWLEAVPGIGLGLGYALAKDSAHPRVWLLLLIICVAAAALLAWGLFGSDYGGPILCAIAMLSVTWATLRFESPGWLILLGGLTFGIYLGHILVFRLTTTLKITSPAVSVVLAVSGSALLAFVLRRMWARLGLQRWPIV